MQRLLIPLLVLAYATGLAVAQPLVFEAEKVSGPADAWVQDKTVADKWNLWSTDNDAAKKWSGGVVLQSPQVMADREKPEDGAPVLRTVLTDLPKGTYIIDIKFGRDLGVSLDGTNWKRLSELNGRLGKFDIDGKFEWWVDDRYATKEGQGSSYYDYITVTPTQPEVTGVANGGFEFGKGLGDSAWAWWSRESVGSAELVAEGRSGRASKLIHPGGKDFALTNAGRLSVKPGECVLATAWLKCQDTDSANLDIVALGGGRTLTWSLASDGLWTTSDWKKLEAKAFIPQGCDTIYLRVTGSGKATVWVDDVAIQKLDEKPPVAKPKTKVRGWAFGKARVAEKLDRGLLAMPLDGGKVYVGWRLLQTDPETIGFNLYRGTGRMLPVKLNDKPLTQTTDFVDEKPPLDKDNMWYVKPVIGGKEGVASDTVRLPANPEVKPYKSIKLGAPGDPEGGYTFQKVGLGDLSGDGKPDYVIKAPQENIDPADSYWEKSPDTYKLEAYLNDGTFLWRYDLGWGIERGIWYSPYVVWDFDGDGKAEIAAKTSEGDPRASDGRVHGGPEYVTIIDGMTGQEKTRLPWPSRKDFGGGLSGYNYAARNQLGVAYLDGKTPCLLVCRGTYTVMLCLAYQFQNGKLQELWRWDNREETTGNWRGQGAHWLHCGDVDADGREEVLLGSCLIDDDGKGMWSTGLGHPDRCFLSDIDPSRPGLEIFYHIEPPQKQNGLCLVDAKTGEIIWGLKEQTYHVGSGMAADIDPLHAGMEVWASEDGKGDPKGENYKGNPPRWLLSAQGEILARDEKVPGVEVAYWDADGQRELAGSRISKYLGGGTLMQGLEGGRSFWADIIGDWREELVTSVKGELRIYTTTIPATDRHVCLLQDPIYRADVAHLAMGYGQNPMLGYALKQLSPTMWPSASASTIIVGQPVAAKITVAAPAEQAIAGKLTLTPDPLVTVSPLVIDLSAAAGQTAEAPFTVTLKEAPPLLYGGKFANVNAEFVSTAPGSPTLRTVLALKVEEKPLEGVPTAQAEDFSAQTGGQVQLRTDKFGAIGQAISHWDTAGHMLQWKLSVPQAGKYWLILRCCSPVGAQRETSVDGGAPYKQGLGATGGFGSDTASDWAHQAVRGADGNRVVFDLTAGEHVIKIVNLDGKGLNLDYLALVPLK